MVVRSEGKSVAETAALSVRSGEISVEETIALVRSGEIFMAETLDRKLNLFIHSAAIPKIIPPRSITEAKSNLEDGREVSIGHGADLAGVTFLSPNKGGSGTWQWMKESLFQT
jgi:hypothetical protein